jgi:hypothetical protein
MKALCKFKLQQKLHGRAIMSLEEFITVTYCFIDDTVKEKFGNLKLRKRGFEPIFSDSEVITMEVVAEFLKIDEDKGAWEYFKHHWFELFPRLCSQSNYAKHAANLWYVKYLLQK